MSTAFAMHSTTTVRLGDLTGADYNPRILPPSERESLRRSLTQFGFVQPVIARQENKLLIGGHQRVTVLRELLLESGMTQTEVDAYGIPAVLLAGLDDAKTKALNLALNRISGEWDYTKLAAVMESLDELPEIELTGFTEFEVGDVLASIGTLPSLSTLDELAGETVEAKIEAANLRLPLVFTTTADLDLVRATLKLYGMTTMRQAGDALVRLCQAVATLPPPPSPEPEKKTRNKRPTETAK